MKDDWSDQRKRKEASESRSAILTQDMDRSSDDEDSVRSQFWNAYKAELPNSDDVIAYLIVSLAATLAALLIFAPAIVVLVLMPSQVYPSPVEIVGFVLFWVVWARFVAIPALSAAVEVAL